MYDAILFLVVSSVWLQFHLHLKSVADTWMQKDHLEYACSNSAWNLSESCCKGRKLQTPSFFCQCWRMSKLHRIEESTIVHINAIHPHMSKPNMHTSSQTHTHTHILISVFEIIIFFFNLRNFIEKNKKEKLIET